VALRNGLDLSAELFNALVRPNPQLEIGGIMQTRGLVHASTDASDGLYYAMHCLTVSQGLGFRLEPESIEYSDLVLQFADLASVDPLRLVLGFGDMEIVCAIPANHLDAARSEIAAHNEQNIVLGTVTNSGQLQIATDGGLFQLANFDNERLSVESQFTAGLESYENRLLSQPLIKDHGSGSFLGTRRDLAETRRCLP
jgi:thiamine monophosphate kinase